MYTQVNNYDLPDGKIIDLGEDKTMLTEKLFNPVIFVNFIFRLKNSQGLWGIIK